MRLLFDVSLLIALLQEHHINFDRAQDWWATNRAHGWASCPLTQNGFLRIVPQLRFAKPVVVADALDLLLDMIAATDHVFWPDDISLLNEQLIDHSRILGPKQLTDIYLLALAVKRGGRLATLDNTIPISAVRGAEPYHLMVI